MRIVTAVLGTVLLMASAPAQEPKKQPDVPFVPTPKEVVTAMLKLAGGREG